MYLTIIIFSCSIDSKHNQKVAAWVAEEIPSAEYSKMDVKSERYYFSVLFLAFLNSCFFGFADIT